MNEAAAAARSGGFRDAKDAVSPANVSPVPPLERPELPPGTLMTSCGETIIVSGAL